MALSIFELFSIGIGPSSSHTVGPMRAARQFLLVLEKMDLLEKISRVQTDLYGSLALTGKGHGTDKAILLGLSGFKPEDVEPDQIDALLTEIRTKQNLNLLQKQSITFNEAEDLCFHQTVFLPFHANGLCFTAFDANGEILLKRNYYSVGGGFIIDETQMDQQPATQEQENIPYPFKSAMELLTLCKKHQMSIAEIMMANETVWQTEAAIKQGLLNLWAVMKQAIERGCQTEGLLPGGLLVKRRAPSIFKKLTQQKIAGEKVIDMNWLSLYAIAVNEENAAGGRIVTAPTNGAAGIIPSVLNYYLTDTPNATENDIIIFLLTAGAIGFLFKEGASISAAEVGCQGEVGVAASMAAGGLTAVFGGTPLHVENAAEIAMEHLLGLTCDPIGGLVQIPCIERNATGSVQAVTAARLALLEEGNHKVSLDKVIETMLQTGKDMSRKYKETSQGGLAVNLPEC